MAKGIAWQLREEKSSEANTTEIVKRKVKREEKEKRQRKGRKDRKSEESRIKETKIE